MSGSIGTAIAITAAPSDTSSAAVSAQPAAGLASTGGNVLGWIAIGVAALVLGIAGVIGAYPGFFSRAKGKRR